MPAIQPLPLGVIPSTEPAEGTWRLFLLSPAAEPLAGQPFFAGLKRERIAFRLRSVLTDASSDRMFGELDLFGDCDE